jgi:hypothetical protein
MPLLAALAGAVIAMGSALLMEMPEDSARNDGVVATNVTEALREASCSHAQAGSDLLDLAGTPDLEASERYRQTRAEFRNA